MDDYIRYLEERYRQYCNKKSGISFNRNTDIFLEELCSMPIAKTSIEKLLKEHSVTTDIFDEDQKQDINYLTDKFLRMEQDEYIAYCIQYLRYLRNTGKKDHYYDETIWIDKDYDKSGDRLELFKSDYIGPIIDYIINAYKTNRYVLEKISKYKEWTERFKVLDRLKDKTEKDFQKHLAEFLFLHDVEFYKEIDTSNGSPDFILPLTEKDDKPRYISQWKAGQKQYIVEIKKYTDESQIQRGCIQLYTYLEQMNAEGCLLIYTDKDIKIVNKKWNFDVLTVYFGDKTPSRRSEITTITLG